MVWWQRDVSTVFGIIIVLVVAAAVFGGIFWFESSIKIPEVVTPNKALRQIIYKNTEYGFQILLPSSWQGYSVVKQNWEGHVIDNYEQTYSGPLILIRNPKWTEVAPWQDVPVMVFTPSVWAMVEGPNATVAVSAAPVGPGKMGENANYIFATPPRWVGFIDALGQDEAQNIVKTFKAF